MEERLDIFGKLIVILSIFVMILGISLFGAFIQINNLKIGIDYQEKRIERLEKR